MPPILTSFCLACLAAMFIACSVRVNQGPIPKPGQGPPVKISAAQLAQELFDGTASGQYALQTLEVSGVVTRLEKPKAWQTEPGPNDDTDSIVFIIPVTQKTTGVKKNYTIRCMLNPAVSPAERKAKVLASGKPVILQGQILTADLNNPQGSMQNCKVISAGEQ